MPSRRQVLLTGSLALVGTAGCLGGVPNGSAVDAADSGSGAEPADSTAAAETPGDADPTAAAADRRVRIAVADGDGERVLVTGDDVATVGEVERARGGGYRVAVALTDAGADAFADGLERDGAFDDPSAHEIRTYLGDEDLTAATLGKGLAAAIESGEWDGRLVVRVSDRENAERFRDALVEA